MSGRLSRVFLTGATGFVGANLLTRLLDEKRQVTAMVRRELTNVDLRAEKAIVRDLADETEWASFLAGRDVVVHAAARAHVMCDEVDDQMAEYRRVNVDGTLTLARQAASLNVNRFVFVSSAKVNGETTSLGQRYQADDKPAPQDPYGLSKLEAELGLMQIAAETGMEVVIIRPPLIYGPGVKGNFATMVKLVKKGVPLPLGTVSNKRSFVGVDNLVDLIIHCIDHPQAANEVFLVSDGEDLSTTELLRGVGKAMGKPARLVPVPSRVLQFGASLLGRKAVAQRLLGSLQLDISKTCELLDWKPPYSVEEGLRRCFER